MIFEKDFPDKLRSLVLPSQIISKKVKLKGRNSEFQGLCPFHNEKTPSFTVNDQKGFFHCFGCGAHGDIISFVIDSEGLNFKEAVIKIAEDFGIPIPQAKPIDAVKENKIERDYLILEKVAQFFEKNLHTENGFEARNYLKKRGLNSTIAKKFRIGFAPNSYESLGEFLRSQNFSEDEILRCGIIGKSDRGKIYDKFRNRVIFPITDKKNRVIAFGGRSIGDELPKYLNSAETEFFKKNQTLYNSFLARKAIFSKGYVVVVEGYMDAIALFKSGLENVVAGLGTALGSEHLKELFFLTDKIVICLDGDSAGIRAAKRVSEVSLPLISAKKNISFCILPNQLDPDDFVKEFGAQEIEKLFLDATPLSQALFDFALLELKLEKKQKISAENKAKIESFLNEKIELIKDNSSKKYFSQFFRDSLFIFGRGQKNSQNLSQKIYPKNQNLSDNLAKQIIAFLLKYPTFSSFRDEYCDISELSFANEKLTGLKELIIEKAAQDNENTISALESSEFSSDIAAIRKIAASISCENSESALIQFRILLLKDLLTHVDQQYKDSLGEAENIETHPTAITNQKIKKIFEYKTSLEQKILTLEQEII